MNILLKSATIIDSSSSFNNKVVDILIEKGIITNIASSIKNPNKIKELHLDNLHVSQGWFDSSVSFGEPGLEDHETFENGLKVAALSGFCDIGLNPYCLPIPDTKSHISYIINQTKSSIVNTHPYGALTMSSKGEYLAELYDMQTEGAVAFYDYKKSISNSNLLKIALQYVDPFNGLVMSYPDDKNISGNGVINEHVTSTRIGLKGIPALSEELIIARDLQILEYTGGKLHIPTISTKKSVELIKQAKQKKLDVSCSVAIHNLKLSDTELVEFNTNLKVRPPLRTEEDCKALIKGLKEGVIDFVTSDHKPVNIEFKQMEFDRASYGSIGLESLFGVLNSIFSTRDSVKFLTQGKSRFGLENIPVEIGNKASITCFNPDYSYEFNEKHIISTSKNAIFLNNSLKGKAFGIISNNKLLINNEL